MYFYRNLISKNSIYIFLDKSLQAERKFKTILISLINEKVTIFI